MTGPSLEDWMTKHPPVQRGVLAPHMAALRQLASAGYTHQAMRGWLASQGVEVSRQAITKALAATPASSRPPRGNQPAPPALGTTEGMHPCTTSKNPSVAAVPGLDATLKDRALAVGEKYLSNTLNPLVAQILTDKTNRKA